jgi:hypothetical protein
MATDEVILSCESPGTKASMLGVMGVSRELEGLTSALVGLEVTVVASI